MQPEAEMLLDIAETANRLRRATLKMHEAKRDLQRKVAMWLDREDESIHESITIAAENDLEKERRTQKKRRRAEAIADREEAASRACEVAAPAAASGISSSERVRAPPEPSDSSSSELVFAPSRSSSDVSSE